MRERSAPDEGALLKAIRAGGPDGQTAERALWELYGGRLRRFARFHLRDRQLAADLEHDCFAGVIEAMRDGRVEDADRLGPFVLATCRHLVWDENRREARRRRSLPELHRDPVHPEGILAPDRERLSGCVAQLDPRAQGIVLLTYCEEWPAERIAAAFATTVGNVRVIRHRALARLEACLEGSP